MKPARHTASTVLLLAAMSACFSSNPLARLPDDCLQLARQAGVPDGRVVVGIRNFAFVPAQVTIEPGQVVTWVNCEPAGTPDGSHTSTSDTGVWGSELLSRGDTFDRTFSDEGAFPYHCVPHPFMKGTVNVE